jgi:PDZ domain-containing protein
VADRTGPRLLAGFLIAGGIVAAATVPVPYVVLGPGPVFDTLGSTNGTPLVGITGAPTYPTTGKLNLTTVSESGGPNSQMTVLGALSGWVDPSQVVVPERLLYPDNTSGAQIQQENAAEMTQSQDAAAVAALRQLKLPVEETVTVASVSPGAPADGKLKVGDRILSVDGVAVSTPDACGRRSPRASPVTSSGCASTATARPRTSPSLRSPPPPTRPSR